MSLESRLEHESLNNMRMDIVDSVMSAAELPPVSLSESCDSSRESSVCGKNLKQKITNKFHESTTDIPHWTPRKNSLKLIDISCISKVTLV